MSTNPDSSTAHLPPASVTICSRNRPQLLLDTIHSILAGSEIPQEIVVVDQSDEPNSILSTTNNLADCKIQYLWVQTRGVASARNLAISSAQHELCLLIDDDMFAEPHWFGSLLRALLQAPPYSVITGQVRESIEADVAGFAPSLKTDEQFLVYEGLIDDDVLYTGNMAIHRTTVEALGWFDERLGAGGKFPAAYDNDFGYRLLKAGYRIIYYPGAVVYHRAWRGKQGYNTLQWNYGRGQGGMLAKHLTLANIHILRRTLKLIGNRLLYIPFKLRRQRQEALGDLYYLGGLLSGMVAWRLTETSKNVSNPSLDTIPLRANPYKQSEGE